MTAKDSLEMVKAMGELVKGFQEAAPVLYDIIGSMKKAVSGEDAVGYFDAINKISDASGDDLEIMMLLLAQWAATIVHAAKSNKELDQVLREIFPKSKLLDL